jgi:hypothetical protein
MDGRFFAALFTLGVHWIRFSVNTTVVETATSTLPYEWWCNFFSGRSESILSSS